MLLCVNACVYACMCASVSMCERVRAYDILVCLYFVHDAYMHACMYVCVCVCVCVCMCMYVCMHACLYYYACMCGICMYTPEDIVLGHAVELQAGILEKVNGMRPGRNT